MSTQPRIASGAPAGTGGQFAATARSVTDAPLDSVTTPPGLDEDLLYNVARKFPSLRHALEWIHDEETMLVCRPTSGTWGGTAHVIINATLGDLLADGTYDDFRAVVIHNDQLWAMKKDVTVLAFDDDTVTVDKAGTVFTINREEELLAVAF